MNRNKAYWSVMGIEPNEEKSTEQVDFENFEKQLKIMIGKCGTTKAITKVRTTIEKLQKEA